MKFHSATEQIWANQTSIECTVFVMVHEYKKYIQICGMKPNKFISHRSFITKFEGKIFCYRFMILLIINIILWRTGMREASPDIPEIRILEVWIIEVWLYVHTNNFNKCHEAFHHFWSEMQTIKVIKFMKCQILNEAKIVTPNLTKKQRKETSPNSYVKKVIYTVFFFYYFFFKIKRTSNNMNLSEVPKW